MRGGRRREEKSSGVMMERNYGRKMEEGRGGNVTVNVWNTRVAHKSQASNDNDTFQSFPWMLVWRLSTMMGMIFWGKRTQGERRHQEKGKVDKSSK